MKPPAVDVELVELSVWGVGSRVMYLLNGLDSACSEVTEPRSAEKSNCPSTTRPALVPPIGTFLLISERSVPSSWVFFQNLM